MMRNPMREDVLVSIIITTYNRPNMLDRAINSALNQTLDAIEVLVIDDNNPNTEARMLTEQLMAKYQSEDKVRYIKHPKNMNGAVARNTGIEEARGKYVTYLDDDDIYAPTKVEKQARLLEETGINAAFCGWDKNGVKEAPNFSGNLLFEILSGEFLARTNIIMMNTEIAKMIGGWDPTYRRNQEVGYLSRYFRAGYKMIGVPEVLVYFDESDRQNASNAKKSEQDYLFMLKDQQEAIELAGEMTGRDPKIIYSYRLRTICLKYLKAGQYGLFLRSYLFASLRFPIRFNINFIKYAFSKILK